LLLIHQSYDVNHRRHWLKNQLNFVWTVSNLPSDAIHTRQPPIAPTSMVSGIKQGTCELDCSIGCRKGIWIDSLLHYPTCRFSCELQQPLNEKQTQFGFYSCYLAQSHW
jgi:hypothetical protein